MFVRDCMTSRPTTVEPETTMAEALALMRSLRIRHLPVLEGTRLVGIVTWTDLMRGGPSIATSLSAWEVPALLDSACVRDVMTADPITVSPDVPVEHAARLLRKHKIGSLPVVDKRFLVGIVTESDLFDALIHLLGGDIHGVRISVELPAGLADLARLCHFVGPAMGTKTTIVITARVDNGLRRAYLRIATDSPLTVAERLAAEGFQVGSLRFDLSPTKATPGLAR